MQIVLNLRKCWILTVVCGKKFHNLTCLCVKKLDYPSLCKELHCFVYFEIASSVLFVFFSSLAVLLFLNKNIRHLTYRLNWCFKCYLASNNCIIGAFYINICCPSLFSLYLGWEVVCLENCGSSGIFQSLYYLHKEY